MLQLVRDVDCNENWSEKKEEASIVVEVEQDFSSLLIDPGLHVEQMPSIQGVSLTIEMSGSASENTMDKDGLGYLKKKKIALIM